MWLSVRMPLGFGLTIFSVLGGLSLPAPKPAALLSPPCGRDCGLLLGLSLRTPHSCWDLLEAKGPGSWELLPPHPGVLAQSLHDQ